jgi:hypothetical protein
MKVSVHSYFMQYQSSLYVPPEVIEDMAVATEVLELL